jgi:hypothetical protein
VKLRIIVLMLCGIAGAGASFAFAGGTSHGENGWCKHAVLFGTAAAPQSFTVTVSKASRRSNLTAGQVVTVALGSSGQTVRFVGEGGDHDRGTTTTTSKDATTTSSGHDGTTTTTKDGPTTTDGSKTTPRP